MNSGSPSLLQKNEPQLSSSLISQGSAATTTGGGPSQKESIIIVPQQKLLLIEDIADSTTNEILEIKEQVKNYLKELHNDIAQRSIEQKALKAMAIDKIAFAEYCHLPMIITERLFSLCDPNKEDQLTLANFTEIFYRIYVGDFHSRVKLIF